MFIPILNSKYNLNIYLRYLYKSYYGYSLKASRNLAATNIV